MRSAPLVLLGKHSYPRVSIVPLFYSIQITMRRRFARTASTFITLFGCVTNIVLAIQVAAAWRSFTYKGEQESEWEALGDKWQTNGPKFVFGLFFIYFALSAIISGVGLYGVLKVRFRHL